MQFLVITPPLPFLQVDRKKGGVIARQYSNTLVTVFYYSTEAAGGSVHTSSPVKVTPERLCLTGTATKLPSKSVLLFIKIYYNFTYTHTHMYAYTHTHLH